MDTEERRTLTVVYATKALKQLDRIWDWNEEHYSSEHADQYIEYLERHIDALVTEFERGKRIAAVPDLRYILIRRKSRGHGHIAVYKIKEKQLSLLYVFHSSQDWVTQVVSERQ